MKNFQINPRPIFALIATVLILIAIIADRNYQYTLSNTFLFLGCFVFGMIFQGIREENRKNRK